jgi:dinuclear metal center YbgI/SA1388 family protein
VATTLSELVAAADRLLQPECFQDYCPNGLQVQGKPTVRRLISGVTASLALLEAALAADADAILVHHGYFWKNEPPPIVGIKQKRLRLLLQNEISLLVYHLPLDAHPQLGNNAQLAARLNIEITGGLQAVDLPIGNIGRLQQSLLLADFAEHVGQRLGRTPLAVAGGSHPIKTIAWCSGGAQSYIEQAAQLGVDAFLSGEVSEQTVHLARELGVHFIAAGHHATERYGAPAVAGYLAEQLGIEHRFIDIDNPA